ncbi:MAG: hypothetical protein IJ485_04205 [Lachnospiraceae bacterium]|nr:hypothetical protein [Lachnospiraceae bacterium]
MDSNNMNQMNNNEAAQFQPNNTYVEPAQQPNMYTEQQPYQQYQQYQQPVPQQQLEEPMSLGEWMISFLIMMIPCVGLVMMFVWAFSSTEKKSKSNYFKAQLIWMAIIFVLYLVLFLVMGVSILNLAGSY